MKLCRIFLLLVLVGGACRPNANLPQGQYYSPRSGSLQMNFPGQTNSTLEYDQFGGLTKRTYRRHIQNIVPNSDDKLLYFAHSVDYPHKTPYTRLGKLIPALDTVALKSQGFVNRKINNQKYLQKSIYNPGRRMVTAEYIVKVDSGYFYLFGYAPTPHFLYNDEDIIIAQDSINRKTTAIIGSFRKRKVD